MLNLYWKIFLAFWFTCVLIVFGAFWLSHHLPVNERFIPPPPAKDIVSRTRTVIDKEDPEALQRWITILRERHNVFLYQFDKQGQPLFNRETLPLNDAELNKLINTRRNYSRLDKKRRMFFSSSIKRRQRNGPRVILSIPHNRGQFEQLLMKSLALRLGIAFVLSGFLCFALARYFTIPIQRLRNAMQQVSAGDYSVRTMTDGHKAHKDELKLLAQDFDRMTEKVEQTLHNQARLIKDVSHELRSPLARLQVALGLAQQRDIVEISPELQVIENEVQAIDELIEQILSLPQQSLTLDDAVDIIGLLDHCIDNCSQEASDKAVQFEFDHDLTEAIVSTRGRLLSSAFENILRNAVNYSPHNGLIKLNCTAKGSGYEVTIIDQGPGVDDTQLNHLFEPFYRTSEARDRNSGGHGLGLAIAKRSVLLHRGEIAASNMKNKRAGSGTSGLKVTIHLPALD